MAKDSLRNIYYLLSCHIFILLIIFLPLKLFAFPKCSDSNDTYERLDVNRNPEEVKTPPRLDMWLIPYRGSGDINLKSTLYSLIKRKLFQSTPRYECIGIKNPDYPYHNWRQMSCIDKTTGLSFKRWNIFYSPTIADKNGNAINVNAKYSYSKRYAFCRSNQLDIYAISTMEWKPEGSDHYQILPYILVQIQSYYDVITKVYPSQPLPKF